jgi:metallo-beta-lactamase class B
VRGRRWSAVWLGAAAALYAVTCGATRDVPAPVSAPAVVSKDCPSCPEWTVPQQPFRVYGNTYYVGTHALGAILIASDAGHVLIDGTVQEGAVQVAHNIRTLGFKVEDVRWILNSHAHFDHAGGMAALQRISGAQVAASASSARVLTQGHSGADDPQYASLTRGPDAIGQVRIIRDGETLVAGPLRVTAHFTPGHTPGGTTWTWQSCERSRCLNIVYADSLSAVSAPGFQFSHNAGYPTVLEDFQRSFAVLNALPCDILLTPHPDVSATLERLRRRDSGSDPDAFINANACHEYAAGARADLQRRIAAEREPR